MPDRWRNRMSRFLVWCPLLSLILIAALRIGADPPKRDPVPDLGPGASLHGKQLFPPDNPWNQDISTAPVDPNSDNLIAAIGVAKPLHPDFGTVYNGQPSGIPYIVVDGKQAKVAIHYKDYGDESDPGPYPIPADAP